jgi:hypothetical protein
MSFPISVTVIRLSGAIGAIFASPASFEGRQAGKIACGKTESSQG